MDEPETRFILELLISLAFPNIAFSLPLNSLFTLPDTIELFVFPLTSLDSPITATWLLFLTILLLPDAIEFTLFSILLL